MAGREVSWMARLNRAMTLSLRVGAGKFALTGNYEGLRGPHTPAAGTRPCTRSKVA